MSMVTMALYNPPVPIIPMASRISLTCRASRIIIIRVRRRWSAIEIEKYGRPGSMASVYQVLIFGGCEISNMSSIPIAISTPSAPSVVVDLSTT